MSRTRKIQVGWTGPELIKLRALFPTAPWAEVEAALPRHHRDSIKSRAHRLKLRRPLLPDTFEGVRHPLIAQLVELRRSLGRSVADVAGQAGTDRCVIYRCETSRRLPTGATLERWAKALDLAIKLIPVSEVRKDRPLTVHVEPANANPS
jgi:hypothetical protein